MTIESGQTQPIGSLQSIHWATTPMVAGFISLRELHFSEEQEPSVIKTRTSAMLLGDDVWWSAFWNTDKTKAHELYIDVITPAIWKGNKVMMIDLDLDVVRTWDGIVEIIDRDEFEHHQKILNYPLVGEITKHYIICHFAPPF